METAQVMSECGSDAPGHRCRRQGGWNVVPVRDEPRPRQPAG